MSGLNGVLVLDGTTRVIVSVASALARHDIPTHYAFLEGWDLSMGARFVREKLPLPRAPEELRDALDEFVATRNIVTIMPCSDKALAAAATCYDELSQRVNFTCPPPNIIAQVLDKAVILNAAARCQVPIPKTVGPSEIDQRLQDQLSFPIVAKPSITGTNQPKVQYFSDYQHLQSAMRQEPQLSQVNVLQEFFDGDGVGINTVIHRGKPLLMFQHRRIHEWPATGGVGVLFQSQPVDDVLAHATLRLLGELQWEGPAQVEFRQNRQSGNFVLMEVNGRFWGSLPLAIRAGIDLPYYCWQIAIGQQPEPPPRYDENITMRWTAGEIRRLYELLTDRDSLARLRVSRAQAAAQFIGSFAPSTKSVLFELRDPMPALLDVAITIRSLVVAHLGKLLKSVIPVRLQFRLQQLLSLHARERGTYVRIWLLRGLRPRTGTPHAPSRILFVCRGNKIRSPLAEAYLAGHVRRLKSGAVISVLSAGTHADAMGAVDARASRVAAADGLELKGRPERLTQQLIDSAQIIVVFDRIIEAEVLTAFPKAYQKVFLISDVATGMEETEINDPDKADSEVFGRVAYMLKNSVERLTLGLWQSSAQDAGDEILTPITRIEHLTSSRGDLR
jgi:predicted ATP-grasp superfamily ATP-dependent carboligase/protein-tyrosine-phosphatase